ncbi:patatin-like phospholipase family protein [Sabulicella rubraurantiaca]|uniref:patatin-like phospholipase family protein n=1 Tax=Sabulicella rubraurantiaca TaxID=2811429 RepID=UPI001A961520|nr:patatin-like phospholipase family protein [Sabulicella rubraurantiaca]
MCALLLTLVAGGCALQRQGPAVPPPDTERATVLGGLANARFWADTQVPELRAEVLRALERERATLRRGERLPPADLLAISGGSDDGAFGAGLLVGWTEAGNRPRFKLVTGVSTGALIAPFAFLGPAYDPQLREVYTGIRQSDVFVRESYLTMPFGEAITDTAPLSRLIARHVNERMLADIAAEYAKGRLLLVGTTNMDAMRPVIWNVGAIAASGRPGALDLLRRVLLASASVPAVFPPVLVEVEADGRPYQEMHVDGGSVAHLFLYPATLTSGRDLRRGALARTRRVYVIRNARLDPEWSAVRRNVFSIAGRAISSMIHSTGVNDIVRVQEIAARDGMEFNLAYIGPDFTATREELFDPAYMQALFSYARDQARRGYRWRNGHPLRTNGELAGQ